MLLGSSYDRDRTRYPKEWDYEPEEVPVKKYVCDGCGEEAVKLLDANDGKDRLCVDCYREWQEEGKEESVLLCPELLITL